MGIKLDLGLSRFPKTARHDELIGVAYQRMLKGGYRHLPVLDNDANLVGIISDRDFQRAKWPISNLVSDTLIEGSLFQENARVFEYMSWPVRTLPHDSELMSAITLMIEEKISAVVLTENEKMSGIITHEDLLKVLANLNVKLKGAEVLQLNHQTPLHKVTEFLAGWNLESYLV